MLNSNEHVFFNAHKCKNVKTVDDILTFISFMNTASAYIIAGITITYRFNNLFCPIRAICSMCDIVTV